MLFLKCTGRRKPARPAKTRRLRKLREVAPWHPRSRHTRYCSRMREDSTQVHSIQDSCLSFQTCDSSRGLTFRISAYLIWPRLVPRILGLVRLAAPLELLHRPRNRPTVTSGCCPLCRVSRGPIPTSHLALFDLRVSSNSPQTEYYCLASSFASD